MFSCDCTFAVERQGVKFHVIFRDLFVGTKHNFRQHLNIGIIIFVSVILKKIKVTFIPIYLRCCKIPKGYSSLISETSILLKLHRLSTIPEQLRIGSRGRKCQEMIEQKQRVQQLRRFDVETTQKKPLGELIDVLSFLKVESQSKYPRRIGVIISTWIRLSKSM